VRSARSLVAAERGTDPSPPGIALKQSRIRRPEHDIHIRRWAGNRKFWADSWCHLSTTADPVDGCTFRSVKQYHKVSEVGTAIDWDTGIQGSRTSSSRLATEKKRRACSLGLDEPAGHQSKNLVRLQRAVCCLRQDATYFATPAEGGGRTHPIPVVAKFVPVMSSMICWAPVVVEGTA
jgi:hypothetical protein